MQTFGDGKPCFDYVVHYAEDSVSDPESGLESLNGPALWNREIRANSIRFTARIS